jgi:Carbohydrate family 9 binding domain-like
MYRWIGLVLFAVGCSQVKEISLYDLDVQPADNGLSGFRSDYIYSDAMGGDVWYTQQLTCITVENESKNTHTGEGALHIIWDKPGGGCPWVGMGVGWDGWTGKDFSSITKSSALSFYVKSLTGDMKSLPWAVGFEDFAGEQAWTGFAPANIQGGVINDQWTNVIVPLNNFPFDARQVDVSSIKQIIFQFESEGDVIMDDIKIVPYQVQERKHIELSPVMAPELNGAVSVEEYDEKISIGESTLLMTANAQAIYVAGIIKDESPLINNKSGADIWNGDAIEIAFSTQEGIKSDRPFFYDGDRHIGIKMSKDGEVFDWSRGKTINATYIVKNLDSGSYVFECMIPWSSLDSGQWQYNGVYGLEFAIDYAGADGIRTNQQRWNSNDREGFNIYPALWGTIKYLPNTAR